MEMEIKPMAKPEDNKMDTSGTLFIGACPRRLTLLLGVSIAIKVTLIFVFAWHILLIMDEFAQLGYAKYLLMGYSTQFTPLRP